MSFYVSTATFFLLHCDEWDRVVALPRHKFVTGATLLQLVNYEHSLTATVLSMLMLSFIFGIVGFLLFVFISVFLMKIQLSRWERVGIPMTGLTPPHCCACPKPGRWTLNTNQSINPSQDLDSRGICCGLCCVL